MYKSFLTNRTRLVFMLNIGIKILQNLKLLFFNLMKNYHILPFNQRLMLLNTYSSVSPKIRFHRNLKFIFKNMTFNRYRKTVLFKLVPYD